MSLPHNSVSLSLPPLIGVIRGTWRSIDPHLLDALRATPVPGYENYHLALDQENRPVLLIADQGGASLSQPVVLENLSVEHGARCELLSSDGGHRHGRFTVITCLSSEPLLHAHFLYAAESLIYALGPAPSVADIRTSMEQMVALFRAVRNKPTKSVQGLWAELLLLAHCKDPSVLAYAWHVTAQDLWDFSAGPQRLEVKSSGTLNRRHSFSMLQLAPPPGTRVLVASVHALRVARGTTLVDLLRMIRRRLVANLGLVQQVEGVAMRVLGSGWSDAHDVGYDLELAASSIRFYDSADVPTIPAPLPIGVTEVHLTSELELAPPMSAGSLAEAGGLFAAVAQVSPSD